jgi:hypothetical protein
LGEYEHQPHFPASVPIDESYTSCMTFEELEVGEREAVCCHHCRVMS